MESKFPMLTSEGAEDRVDTLINAILKAVGDLPVSRLGDARAKAHILANERWLQEAVWQERQWRLPALVGGGVGGGGSRPRA